MSRLGAHIVVVGNEKGGSGKSTTAMHLIVGLMQMGFAVASVDVDFSQATLTRYLANRRAFVKAAGSDVKSPDHFTVGPPQGSGEDGREDDPDGAKAERLRLLLEGGIINHDVVVVDTPGSAGPLSALAHSYADTLITPINDSFLDLDVLAHLAGARMAVIGPSHYAGLVRKQTQVRTQSDGGSIRWILQRPRPARHPAPYQPPMHHGLPDLPPRIGVRIVHGFGERVIFRELFLAGLTIMDLKDAIGPQALGPSHLAARREVEELIGAIDLPEISRAVDNKSN